ncbi:hypothetical protein RND81_11G162700 [Saponaria officinalis]|uniref:FBD domain-containing protein n=1 Tax=Saponaria officinalis TaxID=3572 RepID=A0AAW1HMN9_SAPOF
MSRPLKCSKVSEVEDQEDTDMISRLPDELLGYMLSFLPTKCAVGTSILSSRWRYLHRLTNSLSLISHLPDELLGYMLSFLPMKCAVGTSILSSRWRYLHMLTNSLSFKAPFDQPMGKAQKKAFNKFVNRVLLLHKRSSIEKFSLDCSPRYVSDDFDLHNWISAAISKGVEQLHLSFYARLNALPHCLFSSQKLVKLKLTSISDEIQVPKSINLPNLKILHLNYINFPCADSFLRLISASSLLQELEVVHCEWPRDFINQFCFSSELKRLTMNSCWGYLEVDAPNLAYLYFSTDEDHIALSLRNADCFLTAILDLPFIDVDSMALRLIKAVGHAKELHLLGDISKHLTYFEDDDIPSYPNMVNLRLGYCTLDTWKYLMHWLVNSPQLETLIFEQGLLTFSMETDEWPKDVELVPFSSRVKVIEAYDFRGHKTELVLLKYLLANAEVLQRLSLYKEHNEMSKDEELQARNEVLMFPRASKTCVVHLSE